MNQKSLKFNAYVQALAFLLSGGLIIVLSFFNTFERLNDAIKISQD